MARTTTVILVLFVLYAGSYLAFRATHVEVWEKDQKSYVIFPEGAGMALYYLWRPLAYIDGAATGIGFHIGPHRE